ncbi:homocysteine S-methyltransferase [Mobilicoccus caccae]|nr:homocysteine S-methyltransferase [Mobilicoccus caccae]
MLDFAAPNEVTVLDGGLSTQLESAGHDLSDALWSARLLRDDPEAVVSAHAAFVRAGAQIVTTASYQASFTGFAAAGIDAAETTRLLRLSIDLARQAVDVASPEQKVAVAASVGPYGASLADGSEYRGRYGRTTGELRDWHARRVEVLADCGADLLAIETIPDLDEAAALVDLVRGSGRQAWLSYTIDGEATRAGQPLTEAFAVAAGVAEIVAVGVNCCAPDDVLAAIEAAREVTGLPVVVYPNSGEGWDAQARTWVGPGRGLADLVPSWIEAGARLVGGCCRVGPDQLAEIAAQVRRRS